MPPKPRSQGTRKPPPSKGDDRRNLLLFGLGGIAVVAVALVALAFTVGGGSGGSGDARAALEQAGCTLSATPSLAGVHTVTTPSGTSPKWKKPSSATKTSRLLPAAEQLPVSIRTIESHRGHIKEKLNLKNAFELVRYAIQWAKRTL